MLLLVRTLHILAAVWFTCGAAGYVVTRLAMLEAEDVRAVDTLVTLMVRFRNLMIRPGGMLLVIFGLWTAWYESWPRFAIYAIVLLIIFVPFIVMTAKGSHRLETASAEAVKSGSVTPELRAAMRARPLLTGDWGIAVVTLLFLLLMLLKPA